jgi:hypothetical protein
LYASSTGNQHEYFHNAASSVWRGELGNSPSGLTLTKSPFLIAQNSARYAPLYNLRVPGSFVQSSTGADTYPRFWAAPSQSSATHVDGSTGVAHPERFQLKRMLQHVDPQATLLRNTTDLSFDMMGLTPTTPSTTGPPIFRIDDDLESPKQNIYNAANIPISVTSGRAPRLDVEDWDSKTKVPDGFQASELEQALNDCLTSSSSSGAVVETLICDKLDLVAERSDTTPGLYCSIVSRPCIHV